MPKSYVSVEQGICIVCGNTYDSGNLLLDKRLKDSMESKTITHNGLCPEHQKMSDDGYIALVGVNNPEKSPKLKLEEADRTGDVIHMKRAAFKNMFKADSSLSMVYIDGEVVNLLKAKVENEL